MDYKLDPPFITALEQQIEDDTYDKPLSEIFNYIEGHIDVEMEDKLRNLYYELRMEELKQ